MNQKVYELPNLRPSEGQKKLIGVGMLLILALIMAWNSFYKIDPQEVGIILRFGKFVRQTPPGLHFKLPLIEEMTRVPVERQLKQEFGFQTVEANVRSRFARNPEESVMLTGDLNVAVVEWIVQYRVADPYLYLYKVRGLTETFRAMNEAVMRSVVGDQTVTEVLTVGRQQIEVLVKEKLQELCNQYETGIIVDQVVLQDVNPPDPVKPSWDQVNQAQQQRDRLINEAQKEFNEEIPRARGEAQQQILQSEGYSINRVNQAQGDAARFKALNDEYRKAPDVTRRRMYLETMQKVIPRLGVKLLLDDAADGVLPLLPLDSMKQLQQLQQQTERRGGGGGER